MDLIITVSEANISLPPLTTAFIKRKDHGTIWSPNFLIANNKMLENKEREEFRFTKDSEPGTLPAIIGI